MTFDPNCNGCLKGAQHAGEGLLARERLVVIAGAAQEAFWRVVVEMLPEAKTGDMDVGAVMEFSRACDKAVEIWARTNVRLPEGTHKAKLVGVELRRATPEEIGLYVECPVCGAPPRSTCTGTLKHDPAHAVGLPVTVHNARVKAGRETEIERQERERERRKADLAEHNRDDDKYSDWGGKH